MTNKVKFRVYLKTSNLFYKDICELPLRKNVHCKKFKNFTVFMDKYVYIIFKTGKFEETSIIITKLQSFEEIKNSLDYLISFIGKELKYDIKKITKETFNN